MGDKNLRDESKNLVNKKENLSGASTNLVDVAKEFVKESENQVEKKEKHTNTTLLFVLGIIFVLAGISGALYTFLVQEEKEAITFPEVPSKKNEETKNYSILTGLEIADPAENNLPVYCVQIPNGMDGARPQSGLTDAKIVFEAIAERGITRFATLFQNPQNSIIGPIRSLRLYYLQWDTPFDCTITHAGGADDALAAVRNGGYKDLTENYYYMYRGDYGLHLWNNLFTTPGLLAQNSTDYGRTASYPTGFTRLNPEEAEASRIDTLAQEKLNIVIGTENNTSAMNGLVNYISLTFSNNTGFNVYYNYNVATNSYDRYFANGTPHTSYVCSGELQGNDPAYVCSEALVSPKVIIAMVVQQRTASDNYHENITAIGSGKAFIFQNGTAIEGTWEKSSAGSQIKFYDLNKAEIALIPGQTWISAVPQYGNINF